MTELSKTLQKARDHHAQDYRVGKSTGLLRVVGLPEYKPAGKSKHWFIPVQCACGKAFSVSVVHLRAGHTVSCGCRKSARMSLLNAARRLPRRSKPSGISTPRLSRPPAVNLVTFEDCGKAHQRVIRERVDESDLPFEPPRDCKGFTFTKEATTAEHRDFICKYEWLGNAGYGVRWCFAARYLGKLGGVVLLSEPYNYRKDLGPELECLLQRGACAGWTPKNLGSKLVMFAVRWMVQHTPKRVFYGYSDPSAGEIGTIYQACNFQFLGKSQKLLSKRADGKTVSVQSLKRTHRLLPYLKSQGITLPPEAFTHRGYFRWSVIEPGVKVLLRARIRELIAEGGIITQRAWHGRYALVLSKSGSEQKRLQALAAFQSHPYPKRSGLPEEAQAAGI